MGNDDLEIASRSPNEIIQELLTTYKFKLKGTGPMTYHLGCDFTRDGDDVVDSSMIPHSQLNKRHMALSYHRVREAICADVFKFYHIYGTENPSDVLSKHWGYSQVWHVLQPIIFY
jgi:hypothetical protein